MGQGQYSLDDAAPAATKQSGQYSLADAASLGHGSTGSWEPETLPEKVWRIATTPLVPEGRAEREGHAIATAPPSKDTTETGNFLGGTYNVPRLNALKTFAAGSYADALQTARSFTSPVGLATLGLGRAAKLPGAVGKTAQAAETLAGTGFGTQGAVQAVKGVADIASNGLSPENLQQTLQGAGMAAVGGAGSLHALNEAIPSIKRGGAGMKIIKQSAFGDVPVLDRSASFALTRELADKAKDMGAPQLPDPLQAHYKQEIALQGMTPEKMQQMGITPEQAQYSFRDLHDQKVLIDNALYIDHSVPKSIAPQVSKVSGLMGEELQKTADANGFGEQWRSQADEVRHGYDIIRAGGKYGPMLGGLIGTTLGVMLPESASSGLGELPKVAQAAAPIIGGVTGGILGLKAGKSIIGSGAEALAQRNAGPPRMRSLPPTPEAYHRTILEAKEGKISPGEADRRISRAGGKVRVNPLPPPP